MFRERLRALFAELRSVVGAPDLVLAVIPGLMTVAWVVGLLSSFSMTSALAVGSLPASGTIGYVLFYEPPAACRRE